MRELAPLGSFIGMHGDAKFLQERFEPGLHLLDGQCSLAPFGLGETAGMSNGQRVGQMIAASENGSQYDRPTFMNKA